MFRIKLQDRFDNEIDHPTFDHPMIFTVQKDDVLNPTILTSGPYHHEKKKFLPFLHQVFVLRGY